jgi:peptidoglycan/LPS O-acetylase OafA/YrhL
MVLIAAAAHAELERRATVFSKRVLVRLGEISYCFYLVHTLPVAFIARPAHPVGQIVAFFAALGAAVIGARLLHVTIERPFERRLRGSSRRSAPVTIAARS